MKRLFSVVSFILILTLSLTLLGCGNSTSSSKGTSTPSSANTPSASAASSAPQEEKKALDWPKKPIQIVVPFKAGGDTDFNARTYAKYLEKELGQPLAIVNVDGNGGALGSRKAKDSAPDGYTVLFYHVAMLINTASGMADYSYKDFEMGSIAAMSAGDVICVNKDSKYNTLKDLVEDSKANPGKVRFAGNTGATTYLQGLMLNAAGGNVNIVDAGGSADRIAALKGGHIEAIPNPYGTVKSYIDKGDFKALAITIEKRNPKLPNIPTAIEQGYDVLSPCPYFFLFPKGTPKEIVEKFNKAVEKVATTNKDYAADIDKAYMQSPLHMNPADSAKYLDQLNEKIMKFKDKMMAK